MPPPKKRPPFRPAPRPAAAPPPAARPADRGSRGKGGYALEQTVGLHQSLVITPRIRETVDDNAVAASTMLPAKQ